jgi:hypothetical protein
MAAVPYAHIVAHMLRDKHPKGTDIALAPNPKDILWGNMSKSQSELARKKLVGFVILGVICFFNTIPLFVISILANLASLATYVPFLESWSQDSPASFAFISGVLPPAVSALFGFFLPIMMRRLSRYMGALTHSRLDRAVIARYFAFLVISQLIIFTLVGVIFNSVKEIVAQVGRHTSFKQILQNLDKLPGTINRTYIDQASYWLTFFPLRGFLIVFDLAQIVNLVWLSFKTRVFGRTPRDIREWTQPPDFEYAIYYSNVMFMGAVGLVFAPLAPLVALAAAIVFWLSSWVYKYQMMFVYVSKVETGGRLWNVAINRLLFSVTLMQALLILTIGLQYTFKSLQWLSTIPPIIFVVVYKIYSTRKYDKEFRFYLPTEEELRLAKVHSERADNNGNRLEKRFGHPALQSDLFTPMLHANMMPLLGQVYSGRIAQDQKKLNEYGGQKMETHVVSGGIKIAAIDQRDLEYDPQLYQRDRGEVDWDARSIASTNILSDYSPKLQGYSISRSGTPTGFDSYMARGPAGQQQQQHDIELTRLDSTADLHQPLLRGQHPQFQRQMSDRPTTPVSHYRNGPDGMREAPLHRPYPPSQQSSYSRPHTPVEQPGNMAGRGAFRGQ